MSSLKFQTKKQDISNQIDWVRKLLVEMEEHLKQDLLHHAYSDLFILNKSMERCEEIMKDLFELKKGIES